MFLISNTINFIRREEKGYKFSSLSQSTNTECWGGRGTEGLQWTGFCRCTSVNSYTFCFYATLQRFSQQCCAYANQFLLWCRFYITPVISRFPLWDYKVWLQFVQMHRPSHWGCFYIWITSSSPSLMNSKCRIKANAWCMAATWIMKLGIWLCPECCIEFIITQNNFLHSPYLFTVERSHHIELEYCFNIRETM